MSHTININHFLDVLKIIEKTKPKQFLMLHPIDQFFEILKVVNKKQQQKKMERQIKKYYFLINNIKNLKEQTNKKMNQSLQKKAFLLTKKTYSFFLLKNQICFSKELFLKKKYKLTTTSRLRKIVETMQYHFKQIRKREKWYFFSKKAVFFYFKNFKKIRGLKKKQPIKGKTQREKYRHRVELMIHRNLSVRELFHEKRARKRMLRKSRRFGKRFLGKTGILHYVATTRNIKYTFTTLKHRVLMYFSTGNKKIKKGRRKSLEAKKILARRMARFVKWKKVKKLIVVLHASRVRTINFLVRLYRVRRIRLIAIIVDSKRPHNGCRKKK